MDRPDDTAAKARLFQRLHLGPEILVIANAWDAASARVFEQAGIRAVGTGSACVAFSVITPGETFSVFVLVLTSTITFARIVPFFCSSFSVFRLSLIEA